ncbi:N-6 DNA methylase [Garciella nitratireducens]|uniref:N-6 DNA methylase n=1 Tax=Garciella nitratireducens TaxID=218205 RepID=UPI001BD5B251|nr:N-6 DNA methylase [Garciella nitratireducens]
MKKEKKKIIYFLENLDKIFIDYNQEEKRYVIMKVVLLKWLIDHQRIQWNIVIQQSLYQKFTFENILSFWSQQRVYFSKEKKQHFSQSIWHTLCEFILKLDIFSKESSEILGEVYEYLNNVQQKKKNGMFYTPFFVIDFMLEEIDDCNVQDKILDPACGCGFFLSRAYDKLMEYYLNYPQLLGTDKKIIHQHILEKQLYGIEKDSLAVIITKLILILKQSQYLKTNFHIYHGDALLKNIEGLKKNNFRVVIGNPPYIGHKKIDKKYHIQLKEKYNSVYHDKGDISYCFFQRGIEFLQKRGKLCFFVSRYFLEALYASNLREYLMKNVTINKIIDFYGQRILKGIGIDFLIITLTKQKSKPNHTLEIYRLRDIAINISGEIILKNISKKKKNSDIYFFFLPQSELKKEGWRLLCPMDRKIIKKIEEKCVFQLRDICETKQGIITGKDQAFVLSKEEAKKNKLSCSLLKPWIKGRAIHSFFIEDSDTFLLYSNDIENIELWEQEKNYLWPFKTQLEKRRECIRGVRKWYELQWPRKKEFFESTKIVFPYKASHNRFALDDQENFYSADVYGIRLKQTLKESMSYKVLVLLLNSSIYDFYFKSFAKKLGKNLYEYYPNTFMQLWMPKFKDKEREELEKYYKQIIYFLREKKQKEIKNIKNKVNQWLIEYFEFNQEEKSYLLSLF